MSVSERLQSFLDSFLRVDIFHSARLKLTGFYFVVIAVFCLLLTFGVREFTEHELHRNDLAQRGAVHQIFQQYSDNIPDTVTTDVTPFGDTTFRRAQNNQADVTRQHLNRDFFWMDVGLLTIGAALSYWYAGRTLKPIEEAHEQQKRFTSDASHELRTPLASMKLENEIFLRQRRFDEQEARELIGSNLEEVDRLEKLARNLLALNQYEQATVSHAPTPLTELIDAAVAQVSRHEAAQKVTFIQNVTPAAVDVNPESIIELFTILLDNAVKYGPKDGRVEITGDFEGDGYIVRVRDHGPGITEEDLPHIFERMYRGDKARSGKVSGHGIGLSLARQIAEANDAQLTAGNAEGRGAVFTLTLN